MTETACKEPEVGAASGGSETRRYRVGGMDCAACAATVQKVVSSVEGVESANVSIGNATMIVEGGATVETIQKAVRRAGYSAQLSSEPKAAPVPFWRQSGRGHDSSSKALVKKSTVPKLPDFSARCTPARPDSPAAVAMARWASAIPA